MADTDTTASDTQNQGNKIVVPLDTHGNPAADLIRQKLHALYEDDPKAKKEVKPPTPAKKRSKHQQFMFDLSQSGKSLAEIQTQWHNYYTNLPNDEKHEVWQEFYASHNKVNYAQTPQPPATASHTHTSAGHTPTIVHYAPPDERSVKDVQKDILKHVQSRSKLRRKHNIQSLMFGLGMGALVLLIFLFGFFNERFIAPFITPSKSVSSNPIIIDPTSTAVGPESKIIIPKINVEIPVIYDEPSIDEAVIQQALEKGVVHYPTTSNPGEIGNGAIFGHSANNIFNKGKYKFAFVLLRKLENGDIFYLQKDGKRYAYKVFDKKVVAPSEVSVLYPSFPDKPSTFTLITCDPPGTSLNRLVVTAEQISPDPSANVASTATKQAATPAQLPSNSPTLWNRITNWITGQD